MSERVDTPRRSVSNLSIHSGPTVTPGGSNAKKTTSIYDRSLHRPRSDVSLAAFAFLFSESVQYLHRQSKDVGELERRLSLLGQRIGVRVLEYVTLREGKAARRETRILGILQFIHTQVWRVLFGRPADAIQISPEDSTQYMIVDNTPLVTEFVSVPRDMSQLSCAAFVAGIIESILRAADFSAEVSAHSMATQEELDRTVYLIKFEPQVVAERV